MTKYQSMLSLREIGSYPVSIPTALALDGFFALTKYPDELWINVRTLHRNIVESIQDDQRWLIPGELIVPTITDEVRLITKMVSENTKGVTEIVLYYCSYDNITSALPLAKIREATTEKQLYRLASESSCMEALLKTEPFNKAVRRFKTAIKPDRFIHAHMLTHSPIDLLSEPKFKTLHLLESYTGKIKGKFQFNTKLTKSAAGNSRDNIPFCKFTVQIFGDNNTYIAMADRKLRVAVEELAAKYNWSANTTEERIRLNISLSNDHFMRRELVKYV